ncbi:MAG: hypothetical protein OQK73_13375 [Gammaproteobacteria bacterium]|nr:hypothetical protein [Gammaproteobacteria bacterium]
MHQISNELITFIVLTVVFFILFGVALLVIVDHKSKIPGAFSDDPFSISGMRRGHPVISFVTTLILGVIILALLFELSVTLISKFGLYSKEEEKPELLQKLSQQRTNERMRHFHNVPEKDRADMGKKAICFYCHGDYPHSKQRMVRTLLNMHTQFIGCMTCHIDPRKISEKEYRFEWLNFSGVEVEGPPFGTSTNPDTGLLVSTDDYYSKIVVYEKTANEGTLLEIPETSKEAQDFLSVRDNITDQEREGLTKHFHSQVMFKGRFCSRCHTEENESYLPFRQLGFSEQRISDVTNVNIIGIVNKYREFYLPKLFTSKLSLPDHELLLGKKMQVSEPDSEVLRPRAWWRKSPVLSGEQDNAVDQ